MSRAPNSKTVFTLVFVFVLLALTALRVNGWRLPSMSNWKVFQSQQASLSPQDAIYSMIDAERAGNTKAYLDTFTGSMRDELLQVVKENSEPKFASYLAQSATFQGVAVTITDQPNPVEAQARVDYVYGDRNEVQNLSLRREGKQWKILKVAGTQQLKSPFPFGSGVTD
jgi:hypothetical protein